MQWPILLMHNSRCAVFVEDLCRKSTKTTFPRTLGGHNNIQVFQCFLSHSLVSVLQAGRHLSSLHGQHDPALSWLARLHSLPSFNKLFSFSLCVCFFFFQMTSCHPQIVHVAVWHGWGLHQNFLPLRYPMTAGCLCASGQSRLAGQSVTLCGMAGVSLFTFTEAAENWNL